MNDEHEFYLEELFDKTQEYDLFICTICFALSDLTILSNQLKYATQTCAAESNLSARLLMGFAREAFELLKVKFKDTDFTKKYLEQIADATIQFDRIEKTIEGVDIFSKKKFFNNRNRILHYPKEEKDYKHLKDVLTEMEKDNKVFQFPCTIGMLESKYDFASAIQINFIYDFQNTHDENTQDDRQAEMASLVGNIMNLLVLLLEDFVSRKNLRTKSSSALSRE